MLVVNSSMQNAYNKYTTQRKSYIKVGNNSFFVQNLDISADAYLDGNIVGNAIAKIVKFDIETSNVSGISEFELFDGIWTGNQYEYISLGTFKLFNEEGIDDFFSSITAYDKLINFNKEYYPNKITFPITLYDFLNEICSQAGVILHNITIPNGAQIIQSNPFVENETLKSILKAICQINGCFGIISQDKLKLLLKGTDTLNLSKYQISNPEYKRTTWKINQVVLGMSNVEGEYVLRQDDADIAQNGVHKLVINDNPFVYTQALRESYIDNLFQQVKGFGYVAFETKWEGLPYIELGDLVNIDGKESIILRYNIKSPKGLDSTLSAPSIIDSVVEYVDNSNSILNRQKKTEIIVDKQNQTIQSVVNQTNEQNQKIAQVTQTVEELNSKISDIADITTSAEDTDAQVEINEVNQSEPIRLVVRPIGENISYLYPSDNLYPSDDLYMSIRTIRFHNNTTNEDFDYELPDDLLYYDSENYDEFILDYDGQSCVINKRVGYNADGTTYVLDTPKTVEYEFPKIVLTEGDYTVSILSYENGYIFARLMAKNIYTTQFYTKSEVDSQISQTAKSIDLSVNQKLSNYSTTSEMNSAISLKANEITNNVSATYSTKNDTQTAKQEAINSSNSSTDNKLKNYSTTTQMNNTITQKVSELENEISLEVEKKVDNTDYTAAKIFAMINRDTSSAGIEADKIILTASDIINLLAGNAINLTSKNITIISDYFSVDKNGKIKATSGEIGGFNLGTNKLEAKIYTDYNYTEADKTTVYNIIMNETTPTTAQLSKYDFNGDGKITSSDYVTLSKILLSGVTTTKNGLLNFNTNKAKSTIELYDGNNTRVTFIDLWGSYFNRLYSDTATITNLTVDNFANNSDERLKKDIKPLSDSYVNLLKEINPVSYKYKSNDAEHIGFIAQNVVQSLEKNNLPQIPVTQDDLGFYSLNYLDFIGILWKSNQDLINRVEKLEQAIEELTNEK